MNHHAALFEEVEKVPEISACVDIASAELELHGFDGVSVEETAAPAENIKLMSFDVNLQQVDRADAESITYAIESIDLDCLGAGEADSVVFKISQREGRQAASRPV
jgi:hypothetical protein